MILGYQASIRRLVTYTASLCILIGYAFFAADLNPSAQSQDDSTRGTSSEPIIGVISSKSEAITSWNRSEASTVAEVKVGWSSDGARHSRTSQGPADVTAVYGAAFARRSKLPLNRRPARSSREPAYLAETGFHNGSIRVLDNLQEVPWNDPQNASGPGEDWSRRNGTHGNVEERRRLPQAIIIGVKKGGTRAVLEYLRLHPQVRAAGPEPHFFDKHYHRGLAWYRMQMPPSRSDQLTIEKTPSYFITDTVPGRVRAMSPDVKLVLVLREPCTRAVSDYAQSASKRHRTLVSRTFRESVTDNATGRIDPSKTLVRVGLYDVHLSRWLAHFPRQSFHFVNGERLVTDPVAEMAALQRFLGLPVVVTERHFVFNKTKGFPCILRASGRPPHCLDNSKGRPHPRVDPGLARELRSFYGPHNRRLYRMVGEDFGWPR